ncbi:hypothetical protein JOF41_001533 [Saccharothrix coeruleofusca]|nr:hypothetical protein [Saccharothrix coeruleofusca]
MPRRDRTTHPTGAEEEPRDASHSVEPWPSQAKINVTVHMQVEKYTIE